MHHRVEIAAATDISAARRCAVAVAEGAGANAERANAAALVATELASNILKHGAGGEMLVRHAGEADRRLELLAIDSGPGMASIDQCFVDGYSTAGTLGGGLGAVRRLASHCDIYSAAGQGTVLMARVDCTADAAPARACIAIGAVCQPVVSGEECGDAWRAAQDGGRFATIVADGLGHGALAAAAARQALAAFDPQPFRAPAEILQQAHALMGRTRGGAVAVLQADSAGEAVRYAAVGNIAGSLISDSGTVALPSHNGIVGAKMGRVQEWSHRRRSSCLLVMHSDGLQTRWRLHSYPGLTRRHPAVVAGVLYRDFRRRADDVTVLVAALPG